MAKKSSLVMIVLISVFAIAFLASGCAKKQVAKEEAAAKPVFEAKKEEPKPEPAKEIAVEKPRVEAAKPEVAKPEEAKPEEAKPEVAKPEAAARAEVAPEPINLSSLRIQFAFDDYNLSTKAKENLEKIASWMSKNPTVKMQIEGYACEIGTNEYNLALGERRANSAKKYLEALGVSPARIATISYGEERALDPGHTEEGRSKNRRDEFVLVK